jgi:capsular exopolysaccharide synthesis family protein
MNHGKDDHLVADPRVDAPPGSDDRSNLSRELIAAFEPSAPQVDAMRSLRAELMLGGLPATASALAVVSPASRDGRTFIAANLAIVFAQLGKRTLLVDAHLEKPRLHELFGVANVRGLSAALSPGATREPVPVSVAQFRNLSILVAGVPPSNADDLLASDSFGRACDSLRSQFDVMLVDTPPGLHGSGVDWIAHRCGKALLVVRRDQTRFAQAESFLRRIKGRADVLGCVTNKYRRRWWRAR